MVPAREFFGDSIAVLKAWLDAHPKPTATIKREQRGFCTVPRLDADRAMPWPEKARAALHKPCLRQREER
jgi:hypothetical protein